MSTSNGSGNPLYPFNWLDAVRATAWAPPNLPLYTPNSAASGWDRFPLARPLIMNERGPESAAGADDASEASLLPSRDPTDEFRRVQLDRSPPRSAGHDFFAYPAAENYKSEDSEVNDIRQTPLAETTPIPARSASARARTAPGPGSSNPQFGNARDEAPANDNLLRGPRNAACTAASYECLSHIGVPSSEPMTPFDARACQIAEDLCNRFVNSREPDRYGFTKFPDGTVVVVPPDLSRQPRVVPSKYFGRPTR